MSNQALLDAALDALTRGWSVISVEPRGKRRLVRWREYQERHSGEGPQSGDRSARAGTLAPTPGRLACQRMQGERRGWGRSCARLTSMNKTRLDRILAAMPNGMGAGLFSVRDLRTLAPTTRRMSEADALRGD